MNRRSVIKSLQIAGFLTTALYTATSFADWSQKHPYGGYNQRYGDFPPLDIDQQLSRSDDKNTTEQSQPQPAQSTGANATQPAATSNIVQNNATQPVQPAIQQPAYGGYYQNQMPYGARPYSRNTGFNGPWNNSRSGFSGPWNNRGSGFSGPWGGRNGGPNFTGPWNNNGSSFTAPWSNDRSGFSPWGNGGGWSW